VKKWYKQPKYKAEDKCRFCIHSALWHMNIKGFGTKKMMGQWDKCNKPVSMNFCKCPGFAPIDNLEYLEMLDAERSSL
jgi:hypothetical protein